MSNYSYTYQDLKIFLGEHTVLGEANKIIISSLENINTSSESALCFIDKGRDDKEELLDKTAAKVVIIDDKELKNKYYSKILIKVKDPKLIISIIGNNLFTSKVSMGFVHETSIIHPEAIIDKQVYIGPNCSIGKVKIGSNTIIQSNVVLYDNVEIASG